LREITQMLDWSEQRAAWASLQESLSRSRGST
jgi:hypothetical protein